jgi:hypothetical protein
MWMHKKLNKDYTPLSDLSIHQASDSLRRFPSKPIHRTNMKFALSNLLVAALATTKTTAQADDGRRVRAEDGVKPFIIGGAPLDPTVWEENRRYLVDIKV